jgi:hypothetical protein
LNWIALGHIELVAFWHALEVAYLIGEILFVVLIFSPRVNPETIWSIDYLRVGILGWVDLRLRQLIENLLVAHLLSRTLSHEVV